MKYLVNGRPIPEGPPPYPATPVQIPVELTVTDAPPHDPKRQERLEAIVWTPAVYGAPYMVEAGPHTTLFYGPGAQHRAGVYAALNYWPVTVKPYPA